MILMAAVAMVLVASQQPVPRPFPKPGDPATPPAQPAPQKPATPGAPPTRQPAARAGEEPPTQASLGLPVYPGAQFLVSYDAGHGQRYYLFGTNATFAEIVAYYKTYLKDGGDRVFAEPPIHIWEVGRFREETMAFPPGITVKDYGWAGGKGYLHAKPNAPPARYMTIIQVVPAPR